MVFTENTKSSNRDTRLIFVNIVASLCSLWLAWVNEKMKDQVETSTLGQFTWF